MKLVGSHRPILETDAQSTNFVSRMNSERAGGATKEDIEPLVRDILQKVVIHLVVGIAICRPFSFPMAEKGVHSSPSVYHQWFELMSAFSFQFCGRLSISHIFWKKHKNWNGRFRQKN